jgi:hypothetical protein
MSCELCGQQYSEHVAPGLRAMLYEAALVTSMVASRCSTLQYTALRV